MLQTISKQLYENPLATIWFDDDGVLWARVKGNACHDIAMHENLFKLIKNISDNKKVCLFTDLTPTSLILQNKETREYIASQLPHIFKAIAVLTKNNLQKVAPTVFINLHGSPIPIEIFTCPTQAKNWLKSFL